MGKIKQQTICICKCCLYTRCGVGVCTVGQHGRSQTMQCHGHS